MTTHNALRYQRGCRCDECREAERKRKARYRKAKAIDPRPCYVEPTGAIRRVQALVRVGWTYHDIAADSGLTHKALVRLVAREHGVSRRDHARIRRCYDRLWSGSPTMTRGRKKAQTEAKMKGWHPPMAWDDDTIGDPLAEPFQEATVSVDWQAIDRRLKGDKQVKLTPAERQAAIRSMAQRGATASQLSTFWNLSGTLARRYIQEVAA